MRCPKCGNDVSKNDFVCIYCGGRLREERIESIPIFRRIEEEWIKPEGKLKRMLMVVAKPNRAFWDIMHFRQKIGGNIVFLLTCIAFGMFGWAIFIHVDVPPLSPDPFLNFFLQFVQEFPIFLGFFLFGLIYYSIYFWFANKLYKWGANYSIGLSRQLKLRYGEGKKKKDSQYEEEKVEKTRAQKEAEGEYTLELPSYIKSEKSRTTNIMKLAYMPVAVGLFICSIILLIGLPDVIDPADPLLWNSTVWGIIDWVQVIVWIGWVPITMSIALRDIANASTQNVYISCLLISLLLAFITFMLRPTFLFNYIT